MKPATSIQYSSTPEWIKLVIVALALAAAVFITYHLTSTKTPLDTSQQDKTIKEADRKTKKAAKTSAKLVEDVAKLTTPEREQEYQTVIIKSYEEAKATVDSVALLDFNQQSIYWADEITNLNSIRREYQGSD